MSEKSTIEVWQKDAEWHPYPWRFAVTYKGTRHVFAGVTNQCASKRSAMAKARFRARWLEDGTFDERYQTATKEKP